MVSAATLHEQVSIQQPFKSEILKKPGVMVRSSQIRMSSTYFMPAENRTHKRFFTSNVGESLTENAKKRRTASYLELPTDTVELSSELKEPKMCLACCNEVCNAIAMPCGHGGFCYDCSLASWTKSKQCAICREVIDQVLKVEGQGDQVKVLEVTRKT